MLIVSTGYPDTMWYVFIKRFKYLNAGIKTIIFTRYFFENFGFGYNFDLLIINNVYFIFIIINVVSFYRVTC